MTFPPASSTLTSRRTVLGLGGLALAGALSACTPGAKNADKESSQASGGTAAAGGLTVWHYYGGGATQPFDALMKKYSDEKGVKVTPRLIPFGDFNRTILQSATAKDLPDVILANAFDVPLFASSGLVVDLSDRMQQWGQKDAYFDGPWATTQFEGKTFALPHVADTYSLWLNDALIDQVPSTWDDVEKMGAAATQGKVHGLAYSGIEGVEGATAIILRFLAAGGDMKTWDSEAGAAALESFRRMMDDKTTSKGVLTWIEDDVYTQFKNQTAAMMINSASYMSTLGQEAKDLTWTAAPIPKDKTQSSFLSAENWTITRDSKQADAAWEMITWLQQPEVMNEYLPERNKLPVRQDTAEDEQWQDEKKKVFIDQLDVAYAPDETVAPKSAEIFTAVQAALQEALSGTKEIPDALKALQGKIDATLG